MSDFLTTFNDYENFFNGVDEWFARPINLKFNCSTKDMLPSYWSKTEDGYKCTCRTVGINPKDVKVELKDNYIHIEGKTKMDEYDYSTSYDLSVNQEVINNIKSIEYKSENGITIIYLKLNKVEKKKIDIKQI